MSLGSMKNHSFCILSEGQAGSGVHITIRCYRPVPIASERFPSESYEAPLYKIK